MNKLRVVFVILAMLSVLSIYPTNAEERPSEYARSCEGIYDNYLLPLSYGPESRPDVFEIHSTTGALRFDKTEAIWTLWSTGRSFYEIRWDGAQWSRMKQVDTTDEVLPEFYSASDIPQKYVGFGDSITYGWTNEFYGSIGGYGPRLQEMLKTYISKACYVVMRGVGGERTSRGVGRIDTVLEEESPGYILILEGTNDIQANIARREIFSNLEKMVSKAQAYGSIPVLGTLPPRRDCYYMSDWSEDLNEGFIRPYAEQNNVLLADHWKFFKEQPDWRDYIDENGQHPNSAGYDLMAECWFVAVEQEVPPEGLAAFFTGQSVLLNWDANNQEYGFSGYNVYRKSPTWAEYEKLNDSLVKDTNYSDDEVSSEYYVYAVAAVDRCGNESEYSETPVDLSGGDGGCFIATASYGTRMAREVRVLSQFRDEVLLPTKFGKLTVALYYKLSPPVAEAISRNSFACMVVRMQLKPVVWVAKCFTIWLRKSSS